MVQCQEEFAPDDLNNTHRNTVMRLNDVLEIDPLTG